jgi:hypothetical protein
VRNQTIINLRDKPLYPRPSYSSRHLNPIEYPRPVLSYLVLAGALLYCAVYLASGLCDWRSVPSATAASHLERGKAVPVLTAPEAPAPDMSSDDVRFAAADVDVRHANPVQTTEPVKTAAKAPPKKRKVHIVAKPKEPKEEGGWQTYAFSFADHRTHNGGF